MNRAEGELDLDEMKKKYGTWRVVVEAASGVEKGVVFAVSDAFFIFPEGKDSVTKRRGHYDGEDDDGDGEYDNEERQIDRWEQQLMRRNINGAHLDNMLG